MATIFQNGRFLQAHFADSSADADPTFAECMVVQDGIITHIGASQDAEVLKFQQEGAVFQDVGDKIVLPGFIDGHMHLLMMGQSLKKVDLEQCNTLKDIRTTIKSYAASHPDVPRILCRGWMHFMTDGKALSSMLDDLDPRPIFIDSKDLHSSWCSSSALEEMGINERKDPKGGCIHRDVDGRATGLLDEAAAVTIVWPHLASIAPMDQKLDAVREAFKAYNAAGYTGMVEMAMDENALEVLLELLKRDGNFPLRLAAHWIIAPSETEEENLQQVNRAVELRRQLNAETSPQLRIAGIKVICDGVIDACTAALCEPYSSNGVSYEPLWTREMLDPVVRTADAAGLQCALHAIGDAAIKLAVDTLEANGTPGSRHRIEHLELASSEDAKRLGRLGITASIQPVHADPAIFRAWPKLLGEHRCGRAFAYKEFEDGGATLAMGSDAPTAPHAPFANIYTATTRRSAREPASLEVVNMHFALSLASAISAATMGSAYSCFADTWAGTLEKGKKADFVVVDMNWDPEGLLAASVKETWFEGRKIFDSEA
ncbi:probable metal-dependent hydrolase with the TIM-barrel fold [Rhynchosporium secalis]|uniref:Probable metal-dependent hydrolase with the TIM-barrel fold n=1 Tax=Rhynchosporium secalis TaxID=38038 RepID=A0A1E1M7J3_RHYSE|nr:probable metal-dependent hydrolase with the TIM-barrel fold [Rhynchosporium secalis]